MQTTLYVIMIYTIYLFLVYTANRDTLVIQWNGTTAIIASICNKQERSRRRACLDIACALVVADAKAGRAIELAEDAQTIALQDVIVRDVRTYLH